MDGLGGASAISVESAGDVHGCAGGGCQHDQWSPGPLVRLQQALFLLAERSDLRSRPDLYPDLRSRDRPEDPDARHQYESRHVLSGYDRAFGRSDPGQWRQQQQQDQYLQSGDPNLVDVEPDEYSARLRRQHFAVDRQSADARWLLER